jgi:hypothetical protein
MAGPLCGAFAVLVLFTHQPLIFEHGFRSNNMEAAVVLAYCGGGYHFLRWLQTGAEERGSRRHIAVFTAFLFLAFMTKFVAAVFLPIVCGLVALIYRDGRSALRRDWRRWMVAALGFILLTAPWFIYHAFQHFDDLWATMFRDHVVTRFTAYVDPNHLQPWHFYFSEMTEEFTESMALWWVLSGLVLLVIDAVRTRRMSIGLVLVWAFVPPVLISLGSSKVYHYLYPFLPPFALAAGYAAWWLHQALSRVAHAIASHGGEPRLRFPRVVRLSGGVILLLALVVAAFTLVQGPFRWELGGAVVFRNHAIGRPVIIAALGLLLAGGGARWLGAALTMVVIGAWLPTPLLTYTATAQQLTVEKRPIGALAECIRSVHRGQQRRGETVQGVYAPVSHEAFLHPYFFYLRGAGWHRDVNDDVLREALFDTERARAVAIDPSRYRDFLARHPERTEPAAVPLESIVVALPGPFERCVGSQVRGTQ